MRSGLQAGAFAAIAALLLSACGGGGGGTGTPPTTNPTSTPPPSSSADCPTTGSSPMSFAFGNASSQSKARRVPTSGRTSTYVPGAIAVTFTASGGTARMDAALNSLNAIRTADLDFSQGLGVRTRVLSVHPSRVDATIAALRSQPGVRSVARIAYRHRTSVSANDPYYGGFGASPPYDETSSTPGQWDMHVINVSGGWNAVASSPPVTGATIAVVDTGVDVTHPDLAGGKIVRTRCFVTYPSGTAQTTSDFVTDTDGHGTNVAGIADADTNNGFGFASVAFGAPMFAYRIFPSDPSAGCQNNNSTQCESDTADEASAIEDAVNNGAKVINLSLGGGSAPCDSSDPEYQAVEYAIQHNVVVVAAAGNGDSNGNPVANLDCPAGDPGVIAVGASALDDSSSPAVEKIASYSNYLTNTGQSAHGAFLLAPGGDPSGGSDSDNLHWIENIYSSSAVQSGDCGPDYGAPNSAPADCRIEIAGTSQATPHVAGAASLILAVRPTYTPSQVATALCSTADDIGDSHEGCGRLNVGAAVLYAKSH